MGARNGDLELADLGVARPAPATLWLSLLRGRWWSRRVTRLAWVLLVIATLAIGTWGYSRLRLSPPQSGLQDFYHAVKFYTLDLGPAGGGAGVTPNWQVLLAYVVAALVVVRALLLFARTWVRKLLTGRLLRGHVIVCGGGVHGSRLARELCARHDVVLIDVDRNAAGMQSPLGRHEWRMAGDAVQRQILLEAGARRASWVVVVTGDDFVNSRMVSTLRALAQNGVRSPHAGLQVLVQLEDPTLARFLEEGEREDGAPAPTAGRSDTTVSVFSANAVAAGALFGEAASRRGDGATAQAPLAEVERDDVPHLLLAGDHPLLDAVVLAALRRRRALLVRVPDAPPVRVSVIGPGAVERVARLSERWLPEPALSLEGEDLAAGEELSLAANRWLRFRRTPSHALVVCTEQLDGIGLTLALSRVLGDGVQLTRVATQPRSELDEHLEAHTRQSRSLATTTVHEIGELAWAGDGIRRIFMRERLAMALREGELGDASYEQVDRLLDPNRIDVCSDAAPRVTTAMQSLTCAVLEGAGSIEDGHSSEALSALVGAGITVDLSSSRNLLAAARTLSDGMHRHDPCDAFIAWCEYARSAVSRSEPAAAAVLSVASAPGLAQAILALRAAAVGLGGDGTQLGSADADVAASLRRARRVALFAGGAGSMTSEARAQIERLLVRALLRYDGVVLSGGTTVGLPGAVRAAALEHGLAMVGYVPAGAGETGVVLRETDGDDFSPLEAVAMWTDILAAGVAPSHVRVVAVPGGRITFAEIVLARALGAPVVWLDPIDESTAPLEDLLPLGADDVLALPADPMTLRAFLAEPPLEPLPRDVRDLIAQHIHSDYVNKHRDDNDPADPALASWERLLPAFQQSSRAQADDIPNKLAVIGKRAKPIAQGGRRLALEPDQVELLAEIEHGRYNYERLSAGWQRGERRAARMVNPYLRPWATLDEKTRESDRDAVHLIDPALERVGWGVAES